MTLEPKPRFECVLFDFDGTLTDVEHHAPLYEEAFRDELTRRVGLPSGEAARAWSDAVAEVEASPAELGWTFEGRVVAPASADPYLFANAVARLVLERAGGLDDEARAVAMYEAYRAGYRRVPTRFRAEVKDVLEAILARGVRVFIVTNAFSDDVAEKLEALKLDPPQRAAIAVRGDARKFEIIAASSPDPRFDTLPEEMHVAGLVRPVLLKRGRYFDVLRGIWDETGARGGPERTLVCGDIFELDLALPLALGAHVQLVTHARTLPHERDAVEKLARGAVGAGLTPVLARVDAS